jgi:hypothetical protein
VTTTFTHPMDIHRRRWNRVVGPPVRSGRAARAPRIA